MWFLGLFQNELHGPDFIVDFLFGKHYNTREWEPDNSGGVIGKYHLKADIESTQRKDIKLAPFPRIKMRCKKATNCIKGLVFLEIFIPAFVDNRSSFPGFVVVSKTWFHLGKC